MIEKSIVLEEVAADHPDARRMMEELNQRLAELSGDSGASGFRIDQMVPGRSIFLVARDAHRQLVGCGALRPLAEAGDAPVAELKRMYARAGSRGVGAALLARLEQAAQVMGYRALWLETRRINLRALQFYQRHGYREIPNYGGYVGRTDAICLGKRLPVPTFSPLHRIPS
ncbi:GNAT family N-acetyltransferase [Roseateles amylovorans]|uniref:GNAT family N-acetyltransferase n=1 Tax=Roseateles amylovorans TaxID=2978473 RepID=A0ABY6B3P9_9BURK|nr:GNAT family N-acetyltransferase [Roseateles amylovorans]UXH77900.1 GNAT family N-acetyltransferase [Roseateles amylovorans]